MPSVSTFPEQSTAAECSDRCDTLSRFVDGPHVDLRNVHYSECDGIVRLHGRVNSFHAKQCAQILAGNKFSDRRIENAIIVD